MKIKYATNPTDIKSYDTHRLRSEIHCPGIVENGAINLVYSHYDRFIFGGIVPTSRSIILPTYEQLKSDYFLERRELGVINN